jgi:hypothetical protein
MMKKFLSIAAAIVVSTAEAFTTTSVTHSITTHTSTPTTTQLYSVEDMRQRIKKAGGGIATIVAGDLSCYDPNENGKLQGSGDLETRLSSGASFPGKTPSTVATADPPAAAVDTPAVSRGNGSRRSGTTNLTNLLNGQREEEMRPRKDLYGGKSQC